MTKIFIVGGASYNSIIHLDEFPTATPQTIPNCRFHETVGSTGIGKAVNFVKLGFATILHAFIGDDIYGQEIRDYLSEENINFIYNFDPNGTERHINLMNREGERISIFVNKASFDPEYEPVILEEHIKESDYIVLNIVNYTKKLIPLCKSHQKEIWTDLHDYDGKNPFHQEFIDAADYILFSSINMTDYKEFMESLIVSGKQLVVCTHGKDGATALTNAGEWVYTPIISEYEMVDTNGAGDSFFAGLLYGHTKGYSTEKSMRLGTICSGLSVTSNELAYRDLSVDLLEKEYKRIYKN